MPYILFQLGGGDYKGRKSSENIVIDTLNLTYWLQRRNPPNKITTCDILAAINKTAPILHRKFSGRIIYVTKDQETRTIQTDCERKRLRALYQSIAHKCNVYIYDVNRLPADTNKYQPQKEKSHASLGRDDFYLIMLA